MTATLYALDGDLFSVEHLNVAELPPAILARNRVFLRDRDDIYKEFPAYVL
jgi:hypothetical protein